MEQSIENASVLVLEGYVFELPGARKTVLSAIAAAKRRGVRVAMTAGDAGVAVRHGDVMWEAIQAGVDILFTNAAEATELAKCRPVVEIPVHLPDGHQSGEQPSRSGGALPRPALSWYCVRDGRFPGLCCGRRGGDAKDSPSLEARSPDRYDRRWRCVVCWVPLRPTLPGRRSHSDWTHGSSRRVCGH
jgi:hypothetical protein